MRGVGGRELHRICEHRLFYKEVVKVWSSYKKSYFWWFGNLACGDYTRINLTEKDHGRVSGILVSGKRGEWEIWFTAWGVPSNDWANGGYVDVLFPCGECGFGSLRSRSYSKEWAWNLWTKSVLKWAGWHSRNQY